MKGCFTDGFLRAKVMQQYPTEFLQVATNDIFDILQMQRKPRTISAYASAAPRVQKADQQISCKSPTLGPKQIRNDGNDTVTPVVPNSTAATVHTEVKSIFISER